MIDLHSHILPGVDEGSSSFKETLSIMNEALDNNVNAIVATPHYLEPLYKQDLNNNMEIVNTIKRKLDREIEIYLGNEVYLTDNIIQLLKKNKVTTINGSKYLLIELPLYEKPYILEKVIFELEAISIKPIIAHPERYSYVRKGEEFLGELYDRGVLFQLNACSILGLYGKHAKENAKILLKNGMVHFIASDNHKKGTIYKNQLAKALKKIQKIIGKERLYELTEINPRKVINNEDLSN